MLLVPNVGELFLLAILRASFNSVPPFLKLYQNNLTPSDSDVLADYTEADFSGYADQALGTFSVPITVSGRAYIAMGLMTFLCSGSATPNDIYGYYVTNNTRDTLLWAERFSGAPIVVDSLGDIVPVTPSITLRSEP